MSEADAMDDPDGRAVHLPAIAGRCPVGPARPLTAEDSRRIGRVCVLPQARGREWVPR
ncbi:MAG: hypothetical protein INF50_06715 [Rhodobacter sp.]|nr:hypothetical protein [Rhodobacter sp.]